VSLQDLDSIVQNAPPGLLKGSVDKQGRMQVPVEAISFLKEFGFTKLFITSTDGKTAKIYPLEVWRRNQAKLASLPQHAEVNKRLSFFARAHGGEEEIDAAGRLLLPLPLRQLLPLEKQPVWLEFHQGAATILTQKDYDARMGAATEHLATDLAIAESLGWV
jgi:MraZ protein